MNSHLAHTRKDRDLSQVELAELAATTQATVSRLEAGISRGYVETQVRLARALGVTVEAIFPYPDA